MKTHSDVLHQMEKIRFIFQHALHVSTETELADAKDYLLKTDTEFRAVAYEGIAMGFALKDFTDGTLTRWLAFNRSVSETSAPHVHVGLGWAIAKQKLSSLAFSERIDPFMFSRVIDGIGYYEGTFRTMTAVQKKQYPQGVHPKDSNAFYQGLGRSLWYIQGGDAEKIEGQILGFDESVQKHLWRGVGIASVFVGRCSDALVQVLCDAARGNRVHLGIGAAIAARARIGTDTPVEDADRACRIWCNMPAVKAAQIAEAQEAACRGSQQEYDVWLTKMETELSAVILNLS